jgi:hypothetical protein
VAETSPASITNGAPAFASSGDPAEDLRTLIGAFTGDLSQATSSPIRRLRLR